MSTRRWSKYLIFSSATILAFILYVQWRKNVDLREIRKRLPVMEKEWEELRERGEQQVESIKENLKDNLGGYVEDYLRRRHREKLREKGIFEMEKPGH